MIAEHYILKMLNNYFQYQLNFSVLECCCSLTKKMKKNLLVSPWCVMKDSGPIFIKQLKLRVPSGVLIYQYRPWIFLKFKWHILFRGRRKSRRTNQKLHFKNKDEPGNMHTNKKKTNKKELRNKTCICRPVGHDTSRVRVRIHKAT